MKKNDIETYLRENKPQVKDDPTFMLEVQRKMHLVEGIKTEVDRQRKWGRITLVSTLIAGVLIGSAGVVAAYLYPVNPEIAVTDVISGIRVFLSAYKEYLLLPIAVCAIALGLLLGKPSMSGNI